MDASKVKLQSKIGTSQIVILVLALITALVHLGLFIRTGGVLMLLNSLGYFGLMVLYFVRFDFLPIKREWIRWTFMAYTAVTILAYFAMNGMDGFGSPLGMVTKIVELALIIMLYRQK